MQGSSDAQDQSTMLKRLISISVNFIKVVGSIVSGSTALFYAAGFLAWNSRMVFLGMPETEIVNINYLITGALFFISLPFRFLRGFLFLRWEWVILIVIGLICAALAVIRDYNRKYSKWTFLVVGLVLLELFLIPLGPKGILFEHLPGAAQEGALFSRSTPDRNILENNYSRLIVLNIFAIAGTLLMLSWQSRIGEAMDSKEKWEAFAQKSEEKAQAKRTALLWSTMRSRFASMTPWKAAINVIPLLLALITLLYILVLPMNFIYPVYAKRYPVVSVILNQEGVYPEVQPKLLRSIDISSIQHDLASGDVSKKLCEVLKGNRVPLSDRVIPVIEERGSKWRITDIAFELEYIVRKEMDKLNVYNPVKLFLLSGKGEAKNLSLYSEDYKKIFQVKSDYIEELCIIKHEPVL